MEERGIERSILVFVFAVEAGTSRFTFCLPAITLD